jgi:putative hydrolase of HD superfamily
MDPHRLDQQIRFILELDKLKSIYRRTILIDGSRNENSAEHSWHIALMAPLLAEHADSTIDVLKTMKMLLVHDIVEIDAGDTYCYDTAGNVDKAAREQCAADRIFGLLPEDQRAEFRALWEEFEQAQSPEATFANALDRLQPLLNNYHTDGESWRKHNVTSAQVQKRAATIAESSRSLGSFAADLLKAAVEKRYLPQ